MPAPQYRAAELMTVLCMVCLEPFTKKAIPDHQLAMHGIPKGGKKLKDRYILQTEETENERTFVKIKSIADINQYKDLGK